MVDKLSPPLLLMANGKLKEIDLTNPLRKSRIFLHEELVNYIGDHMGHYTLLSGDVLLYDTQGKARDGRMNTLVQSICNRTVYGNALILGQDQVVLC